MRSVVTQRARSMSRSVFALETPQRHFPSMPQDGKGDFANKILHKIDRHWNHADKMSYIPKPLDTSAVVLPPELGALTERLAENTHELWAAQRLSQGWSHGPQRDDTRKLHPCLVPYEQLPESEREYDRITALGTLKAILKLGYQIHPPQP